MPWWLDILFIWCNIDNLFLIFNVCVIITRHVSLGIPVLADNAVRLQDLVSSKASSICAIRSSLASLACWSPPRCSSTSQFPNLKRWHQYCTVLFARALSLNTFTNLRWISAPEWPSTKRNMMIFRWSWSLNDAFAAGSISPADPNCFLAANDSRGMELWAVEISSSCVLLFGNGNPTHASKFA